MRVLFSASGKTMLSLATRRIWRLGKTTVDHIKSSLDLGVGTPVELIEVLVIVVDLLVRTERFDGDITRQREGSTCFGCSGITRG